jgi:polysaccharide export outer membrane protein
MMTARGELTRVVASLVVLTVLLVTPAGPVRAASDNYVIGTDDVLAISVWDNKELDQVVFVRPDGKISLPLVGQMQAAGRTVAQLEAEVTEKYQRTIKGAQVTISVKEIKSRPIYFIGGVNKPGPLQLTNELTLLQAISLAGGFAPAAALESAYVLRGEQRIAVDFGRLLQRAEPGQNIKLQPGDTIVVPVGQMVYIQGEVRVPGAIPYTRDLTVMKAIAQSGGFTPAAAPKRVTVITQNGAKKTTVKVNVSDIIAEPDKVEDVDLKPNDIIIVPQRIF